MDQLVSTRSLWAAPITMQASYKNTWSCYAIGIGNIMMKHTHTPLGVEKPINTEGLEMVWEKDSDEQIILTGGVRRY